MSLLPQNSGIQPATSVEKPKVNSDLTTVKANLIKRDELTGKSLHLKKEDYLGLNETDRGNLKTYLNKITPEHLHTLIEKKLDNFEKNKGNLKDLEVSLSRSLYFPSKFEVSVPKKRMDELGIDLPVKRENNTKKIMDKLGLDIPMKAEVRIEKDGTIRKLTFDDIDKRISGVDSDRRLHNVIHAMTGQVKLDQTGEKYTQKMRDILTGSVEKNLKTSMNDLVKKLETSSLKTEAKVIEFITNIQKDEPHKAKLIDSFIKENSVLLGALKPDIEKFQKSIEKLEMLEGFVGTYGQRSAGIYEKRDFRQKNLIIDIDSTDYTRDSHKAIDSQITFLKNNTPDNKDYPKKFIINSESLMENILKLKGDFQKDRDFKITQITTPSGKPIEGLFKLETKGNVPLTETELTHFGQTPSLYQIKRATTLFATDKKFLEETLKIKPKDIEIDNNPVNFREKIINSEEFLKIKELGERGEVDELGTRGDSFKDIYKLTTKILSGIDLGYVKDPIQKLSVDNISRMLKVLANPENITDSQFTQTVSLMFEDLNILLGSKAPSTDSFEKIISNIQKERIPSLQTYSKDVKVQNYMASSGMGAFTTALTATKEIFEDGISQPNIFSDYFEVPEVLEKLKKETVEDGKLIIAPLNPSTIFKGGNDDLINGVDVLSTKMLEKLPSATLEKPITLILDITIEKNKTELDDFFKKPEVKTAIEEGKLNVIMWKSYQKYGSLGTGKIMAGGITVINNGSDKFKAINESIKKSSDSLGAEKFPENQLLKHILKTTSDSEIDLVNHATKNANFVVNNCFGASGTSNKGLPFLMLDSNYDEKFISNRSTIDMLNKLGIEPRDSFSFMLSSCLEAGGPIRINFGHESENVLIEKFFTIGQVTQFTKQESLDNLLDMYDTFKAKTPKSEFEAKFENNIKASYLNFVSNMLPNPPSEALKDKAFSRLEDFIKGDMKDVTKETQSKLLKSYFDIIVSNHTELNKFESRKTETDEAKKIILEKMDIIPQHERSMLISKLNNIPLKDTFINISSEISKFGDGILNSQVTKSKPEKLEKIKESLSKFSCSLDSLSETQLTELKTIFPKNSFSIKDLNPEKLTELKTKVLEFALDSLTTKQLGDLKNSFNLISPSSLKELLSSNVEAKGSFMRDFEKTIKNNTRDIYELKMRLIDLTFSLNSIDSTKLEPFKSEVIKTDYSATEGVLNPTLKTLLDKTTSSEGLVGIH